MESFCEICETERCSLVCNDCPKVHLYCPMCYEFAHKTDMKKAHVKKSFTVSIPEEVDDVLTCPTHPHEPFTCVCNECQALVCVECIVAANHKGHTFEGFHEAFNKLTLAIKEELKTDDFVRNFMSEKEEILQHTKERIKMVNKAKQNLEESYLTLLKIIDDKYKEASLGLDKKIVKLQKKCKDIEALDKNMNFDIIECKTILRKGALKIGDYHRFFKCSKNLSESKAKLSKWFPFIPVSDMNYMSSMFAKTIASAQEMIPTKVPMEKLLSDFKNSGIIKDHKDAKLLYFWVVETQKTNRIRFRQLWKGSKDGFEAKTFHSRCDDKGPTLMVVQSTNNYVFGGFTTNTWRHDSGQYDASAFVYSLTKRTKHAKQSGKTMSTSAYNSCGPIFGNYSGTADIRIEDNCNTNESSSSAGNTSYELPDNVDGKTYFAGAHKFTVKEIEVYQVNDCY